MSDIKTDIQNVENAATNDVNAIKQDLTIAEHATESYIINAEKAAVAGVTDVEQDIEQDASRIEQFITAHPIVTVALGTLVLGGLLSLLFG